ncbi:MAG: protein-disulfide reductase DsbD domain-containing protein [Bryobacteraceae bacterium]|jgi:thioredoxin:protein disulfide reductase
MSAVALLSSLCCFGQNNVLTIAPPEKVTAKIGAPAQVKLSLELRSGYHCNSNKPADDYLIPLKLTWTAGALEAPEVVYPAPQMEKYSFSENPLSVYTGNFELVTKFKVAASAMPGQVVATGKLRYQACTDRMCLPPKTIDVSIPIDILK